MSSWESMSATLKPEHWGLHGGMPADNCSGGLPNAGHRCTGGNPMSQRNYPCDSLIVAYFDTSSADLDAVGESAFKKQLWLCMAGMVRALWSLPRPCLVCFLIYADLCISGAGSQGQGRGAIISEFCDFSTPICDVRFNATLPTGRTLQGPEHFRAAGLAAQ